mgnify:CR=1 FL=1
MKPFLKQVSDHYYQRGDIGKMCFIFPNRRSMAFFRKYLGETVSEDPLAKPLLAPSMYTVNDFFSKVCGIRTSDRLSLLLLLYESYKTVYPKAESLDDFIFWGDIILSDFDDIDKYLVDAKMLLANVEDFKSIQDTYEYLSKNQVDALNQFIRHFRDDSGRLTVDIKSESDDAKTRFLQIWDILYPLYDHFRKSLKERGIAYEGMIYRELSEKMKSSSALDVLEGIFPETEKFIFVGLNTLSESERVVMKKMHASSLAEFSWDYVSDMIKDSQNRSSFFMKENLAEFGEAFPLESVGPDPEFEVIEVASSVGQAKLLPGILGELDLSDPVKTAVVLPDEAMLIPVLNSIPEEIKDINVTMGYPLSESDIYSLMRDISSLQLHLRQRNGDWMFYHRQVSSIFSSAVLGGILTEEEAAVVEKVKEAGKYYVSYTSLQSGELLSTIFRPVVKDLSETSSELIRSIVDYQREILSCIGGRLAQGEGTEMELDLVKRYFTALNIFRGANLEILPTTYFRLLEQHLALVSVPFKGEPLKGLQIMGPLETRALDFDNLIILGANEGIFPRKSVSSSFIPPELRKGFGLPTYEHQDSMWAYYFYRMVQRAKKVWMLCDSRTEGLKTGEESRFIKQLEYHFKIPLIRKIASSPITSGRADSSGIEKTPEDVALIRQMTLSASSLKNYLDCPAMFYFGKVKHLLKDEEIAETMDDKTLGTVYHAVMQDIYTVDSKVVTADYLESVKKDKGRVQVLVRRHILENIPSDEVTGRDLVVEDVIFKYVEKTLEKDIKYLKDNRFSLNIIGLEKEIHFTFDGFKFNGYIDRIDSPSNGVVRVIDYKTGKVNDEEFNIEEGKEEKVADALFLKDNDDRPKITLQMFLYDEWAKKHWKSVENSIYSPSDLFVNDVRSYPFNEKFNSLVKEGLSKTLEEMADVSVPFRRTENEKTCERCDFKMICGR